MKERMMVTTGGRGHDLGDTRGRYSGTLAMACIGPQHSTKEISFPIPT